MENALGRSPEIRHSRNFAQKHRAVQRSDIMKVYSMKLATKLLLAFLFIAVIGISLQLINSVINRRTITRLVNDLRESNLDDVKTTNSIADIMEMVDHLVEIQRSLLIPGLGQETRDGEYKLQDMAQERVQTLMREAEAHWANSSSSITGYTLSKWPQLKKLLQEYVSAIQELEAVHHAIDATFIHDPKQIVALQQEFRGNHFNVASRAGEVLCNEKAVGQPLTFDESKCSLQRWRVGVLEQTLPYHQNAVIRKAVDELDKPHRLLHKIAEETYDLFAKGDADAAERLAAFNIMMPAAREMDGIFKEVMAEAGRSQELYDQVFALTTTRFEAIEESLTEALQEISGGVIEMSAEKAANAVAEGENNIRTSFIMTVACIVLNFLLFVIVQVYISRRVIRPLTRTIDNLIDDAAAVSADSEKIGVVSSDLHSSSITQSESVGTTSSALEEITAVTHRNAENAESATKLMNSAATQVNRGEEAVTRMTDAMNEINVSSERIESILKTIEGISFQTNLLALNAAVEAARAGEAGKGFAVVADEVRSLSQRSAQASRDTASLVTQTLSSVKNGNVIVKELDDEFKVIKQTTEDIDKMIRDMAGASMEQADGITQINDEMGKIDRATQQSRENAVDMAESGKNIAQVSTNLQTRISDLQMILYGKIQKAISRSRALLAHTPK